MEKEFVPYELALKIKELGFDEECFSYYDLNNKPNFFGSDNLMDTHCVQVNRPTYSQAFRWFREKHNIDGLLHKTAEGSYYFWITECEYENYNHYKYYNQMVYFNTYEEAEIACLKNLIELVESKSE